MSSKRRFDGKSPLRRIFTKGQKREFRLLRIVFLKNSLARARFAVVVPKAVDKRAVVRNRLRRRASERIRTKSDVIKHPLDFAVILKKGAGSVARKELYEELDYALNSLNRI